MAFEKFKNFIAPVDDDDADEYEEELEYEESEAKPKLMPGQTVRVLGGKICPKCHSNEGVIGQNFAADPTIKGSKYVFCNKCKIKITEEVTCDTVELI
jgi:hypothetical protein